MHDGVALTLAGVTLRAVHTPGHASNHVCFLLEEQGWLFTGDHLMSGSTVVILPPDGSMRHYWNRCSELEQLPLTALLPGHGAAMPEPHAEIRRIVAHRLQREAKVVDALRAAGGVATLDALLPVVYADVPVRTARPGALLAAGAPAEARGGRPPRAARGGLALAAVTGTRKKRAPRLQRIELQRVSVRLGAHWALGT